MITQTVTVDEKSTQNIIIGRRGTYETEEVVFDLSYLVETFGNGVATLLVRRSVDITAYPAVTTQDGNTLTWVIGNVDTAYKGHGECELFWYVDGGLVKSAIYSVTVLRDIGDTTQDPPDPYETWLDTLTEIAAQTEQNATDAAGAKTAAETAQGKAEDAQTAAETAQGKAEDAQEAAEAALAEFTTPTASATTLSPGSSATASYSNGAFAFGIPRGQTGAAGRDGQDGAPGQNGADGTTFTPAVSAQGVISWTNDGGKTNPASVDLAAAVEGVFVVNVSGTTPSITGAANTRYICEEVSTISITPPASGIIDVVFTSGSPAAVLTLPNTVLMPEWFEVEAGMVYEVNIADGVYGSVMQWAAT